MKDPIVRPFKLTELQAAGYNPRTIDDAAMAGLKSVIRELGVLELPVVNMHTGKPIIVSGHQRVTAMLAEGITTCDCIVVDYDETTEKMANLALNNPNIQGKWDLTKANKTLAAIAKTGEIAPGRYDALLAEVKALSDKMKSRAEPVESVRGEGEEGVPGIPEAQAVASKVGKVYSLGQHFLFCGDMQEVGLPPAAACITDFPYGVDYKGTVEIPKGGIANDAGGAVECFLPWFSTIFSCVTSGPVATFLGNTKLAEMYDAMVQSGGDLLTFLAWIKDGFTLNPLTCAAVDYKPQHELVLLGQRRGSAVKIPGVSTNAFKYRRPTKSVNHPTEKPVEVMKWLVETLTLPGQTVLDPFAGGGATLLACEEVGRVCYACELDPAHCDTIRRRWVVSSGGQAVDWLALTPEAK